MARRWQSTRRDELDGRWRRVEWRESRRTASLSGPVGLAVFCLGAALCLVSVVGTDQLLPVIGAALIGGGCGWRLLAIGLFLSTSGVRVRRFTRTWTRPWPEVREFAIQASRWSPFSHDQVLVVVTASDERWEVASITRPRNYASAGVIDGGRRTTRESWAAMDELADDLNEIVRSESERLVP